MMESDNEVLFEVNSGRDERGKAETGAASSVTFAFLPSSCAEGEAREVRTLLHQHGIFGVGAGGAGAEGKKGGRAVEETGKLFAEADKVEEEMRTGVLETEDEIAAKMSVEKFVETVPCSIVIEGRVQRIFYHSPDNPDFVIARFCPSHLWRDDDGEGKRMSWDRRCFTIKGEMFNLAEGATVVIGGEIASHPKYGAQLAMTHGIHAEGFDTEAIYTLLVSNHFAYVGPETAKKLLRRYDTGVFEELEEVMRRVERRVERARSSSAPLPLDIQDLYTQALCEKLKGDGIKRISRRQCASLAQGIRRAAAIREIIRGSYGLLGVKQAAAIYTQYGWMGAKKIVKYLNRDPYLLAELVSGFSFRDADRIAQRRGIAPDAPQRLRGGVRYCIAQARRRGHTLVPRSTLLDCASKTLAAGLPVSTMRKTLTQFLDKIASADENEGGLDDLLDEDAPAVLTTAEFGLRDYVDVVVLKDEEGNERGWALYRDWRRARDVVRFLTRTLDENDEAREMAWVDAELDTWEHRNGIELGEEQREAVRNVFRHKVSIITGGPGTGKSTITKAILDLWQRMKKRSMENAMNDALSDTAKGFYYALLMAPTGKAAKRMSEITGREAETIHKMLAYDGFTFGRKSFDPFDTDEEQYKKLLHGLLIIDESSMIDASLFSVLMRTIANSETVEHVVFIGDSNQLPPVGAGQPFADLLDSGLVPKVKLQHIYRQAEDSGIVNNAYRILRGERPVPAPDFDLLIAPRNEIGTQTLDLVERYLAEGFSPEEIQVLAPMYRGSGGIDVLNETLQQRLNPPAPNKRELERPYRRKGKTGEKWTLREGDRVVVLRNDRDLGVKNGDVGYVAEISPRENAAVISFGDRRNVLFSAQSLNDLSLAYALSVHKSQGSEWPAVIVTLSEYSPIVSRPLLYTGETRGKKRVALISPPDVLHQGLANLGDYERRTALGELLEHRSGYGDMDEAQ